MSTRTIVSRFSTGLGFVIGFVFLLGCYFLVQAVAPGTVQVPTFDTTTDVDLSFNLDCTQVAVNNGGSGVPAVATCPAGYLLTGGTGACETNNAVRAYFHPNVATNSYSASCGGVNYTAYAICCRFL